MKYNYKRDAIKPLPIKPFLNMVKDRNQVIEQAEAVMPQSEFNANMLAAKLHPEVQYVQISEIKNHGDAKTFTFVPDEKRGTKELAYFRAGQYISVTLDFEGGTMCKPYALRSNPKDSLGETDNHYMITVKRNVTGLASDYMLDSFRAGDKLEISGPLGEFYYQKFRDEKHVVALAGGSGITPFYSMAAAIVSGIEDFDLTILYGSRTSEGILLKEELEELAMKSGGRVKVIHVLSHEEKEGYEHGFLTAELIEKYAPEKYSLFICGPKPLYVFGDEQAKKLGLKRKAVRKELPGDYANPQKNADYPAEIEGKTFKLNVHIDGRITEIQIRSDQTILQAMEQAHIKAPSHCRSGECGWCHSKLLSGKVYIPQDMDGRRMADLKFGWIHPCASYAAGDVAIEVYPVLKKQD